MQYAQDERWLPASGQPWRRLLATGKSAAIACTNRLIGHASQPPQRLGHSDCHLGSTQIDGTGGLGLTAGRDQIPIAPGRTGPSLTRDFVHCRFADAGRPRVSLGP